MKPYLIRTYAFDANYDKQFNYTWAGAQIFGVQVQIDNNSTSNNVFNRVYETMKTSFTVPSGTLTNGIQYTMRIRVYDVDGDYSEWSDRILFYCFTTPEWEFTNISSNQNIETASITPQLRYYQKEGEELSEYNILLYDVNQQLLYQTGSLYDDDLTTTITGLLNDNIYYLQGTCNTVNGIEADTGLVQIYVRYILPNFYSILYAENYKSKGYIKLSSNIKVIAYWPEDGYTYIDDKYVDLRDMTLTYYDGFTIPKQFTCILFVKDYEYGESILEMSNSDGCRLSITPLRFIDDQVVFRLNDNDYVIYSNILKRTSNFIRVWFRRNNGLFELYIRKENY